MASHLAGVVHKATRATQAGVVAVMLVAATTLVADSAAAHGALASAPAVASACSCLRAGEALHRGGAPLRSPDGRFVMWLQTDGNLVEYAVGANQLVPRWSAGQSAGWVLWMQGDGNVVLYRQNGTPIWATHTAGHPNSSVHLQSDANFVVYSAVGLALYANHATPPPYLVKNMHSGECLHTGLGLGTPIDQQPCDPSSANQIQRLVRVGADRYLIGSAFATRGAGCVEVPLDVVTPVHLQWSSCATTPSRTFHWVPVGPPGQGIILTGTPPSVPSNCVGVTAGSTADGAAIGQEAFNLSQSQMWDLVPWGGPPGT